MYIYFVYCKPHCCKCRSFGCIEVMKCVCQCGYSGSKPKQLDSPWQVKRAVGFPKSTVIVNWLNHDQPWHVSNSLYYREYRLMQYTIRSFSFSFIFHLNLRCIGFELILWFQKIFCFASLKPPKNHFAFVVRLGVWSYLDDSDIQFCVLYRIHGRISDRNVIGQVCGLTLTAIV